MANARAQIVEIIVSTRDEEREIVRAIFAQTETDVPLKTARGGNSRAESVYQAAKMARGDFVLIHDAARPCLTCETTARVVAAALRNGAAIAALPADDTVKRVSLEDFSPKSPTESNAPTDAKATSDAKAATQLQNETAPESQKMDSATHSFSVVESGNSSKNATDLGAKLPVVRIEETLERSRIFLAQTPQMFRRDWLLSAFESAFAAGWAGTDCASYVERWLVLNRVLESVEIVRGDARNLKVTYADDLARAADWLKR